MVFRSGGVAFGVMNAARFELGRSCFYAVLEYAIIAILILAYNTVWTREFSVYDYVSVIKIFACAVAFVMPAIRFVAKPDIKLEALGFVGAAALGFCASVFLTANMGASLIAYLPIVLSILYAETIKSMAELKVFFARFVNVVCVIAAVSLLFFFLGSVFGVLKPTGSVVYEWEGAHTASSYSSLYFETQQISFFGYEGIRNDGPFTEAPMFNLVLCIAFLANALLLKRSTWKSVLLVVTILTTFSTTGYLAVLIAFGCMLITARINNKLLGALRIIAVPIIAVLAVVLFVMILGDKSSTGSYGVRSDHLAGCTMLFFQALPFGTGFGNDGAFYDVFRYEQGLSVGTMYLLAQGGLFAVALYGVPSVFALIEGLRKRDAAFFAFQISFAWLVFVTQAVTLPSFWLFVFLALWKYPHLMVASRE